MKILRPAIFSLLLTGTLFLPVQPAAAQWAADPGATARNAFGPGAAGKANQCRGACGSGCPGTCDKAVSYECQGNAQLRRIESYDCGTHQGCRVHDDCLDTCLQKSSQPGECQKQCDTQVMERFGFENSASWLIGRGPYDGMINFEYTIAAPASPEPAYHCPDGATRQCGGSAGCAAADGTRVEPVFENYPATNGMRVSAFRTGLVCGEKVCQQTASIEVWGEDTCPGGSCTHYGMEFDFANADPAASLECSTSTSGGDDDFVGGLLKQGGDAMTTRGGTTSNNGDNATAGGGEDGMAELLGMFGKVLASGDSPDDVDVTFTPYDEQGNPDPSRAVGTRAGNGPPPVPRSVDLPGASGHLFVPMYQLKSNLNRGEVKERKIRCTHKGAPVLETVFRLEAV